MRICVVTSYTAAAEPRAPRHAIAARIAFPQADVVFVDLAAADRPRMPDPSRLDELNIRRHTAEFPTRTSNPFRLAFRKARTRFGLISVSVAGTYHESVFGDRVQGLTNTLRGIPADVYIAHNIETLLPAINAAKTHRAAVVFDCMEYYSDMGEGQSRTESLAAKRLEARYLPVCALVMASSDGMADALASEYGIARPLPSYNTPPRASHLPGRLGGGLNLYWRNSVVGFGQRGLDDALEALALLPADVRLFLQGRQPADGGASLSKRVHRLGIRERVTSLEAYTPSEAVQQAAAYDVGLCLERRGPRNHDLTVSNKMFDYHMAGLAVIATDLPSLRDVIHRSGGGLLCKPGNPTALAEAVLRLRSSAALMADMQNRARRFAMEEANWELELEKIASALRDALGCGRAVAQLPI